MVWANKDDRLVLFYAASSAPSNLQASVDVRDSRGKVESLTVGPITSFTTDRTIVNQASAGRLSRSGEVVGASVVINFTEGPLWGANLTGIKRGTLYATLLLIRATGEDQLLCKGYLYDLNALGLGDFVEATSGRGLVRSIQIADPAAGTEITSTVPTNALWRPLSLRAPVTGGSAAFNPSLIVTDGTDIKWQSERITVAASTAEVPIWSLTPSFREAGISTIPIAELLMPEGYVIQTEDITADDDYDAAELTVEEWLAV